MNPSKSIRFSVAAQTNQELRLSLSNGLPGLPKAKSVQGTRVASVSLRCKITNSRIPIATQRVGQSLLTKLGYVVSGTEWDRIDCMLYHARFWANRAAVLRSRGEGCSCCLPDQCLCSARLSLVLLFWILLWQTGKRNNTATCDSDGRFSRWRRAKHPRRLVFIVKPSIPHGAISLRLPVY